MDDARTIRSDAVRVGQLLHRFGHWVRVYKIERNRIQGIDCLKFTYNLGEGTQFASCSFAPAARVDVKGAAAFSREN